MMATMKKYNLIKIRIKIGYHSLVSRTSICDMFISKILSTYKHYWGQPEILKHKDVIKQFEKLMKAGGKGFSAFIMTYSLAMGYLDEDENKETIQQGADELNANAVGFN